MATDLTAHCREGYDALATKISHGFDRWVSVTNPYIWSSSNWMAFEAGVAIKRQQLGEIRDASTSRGYSVKVCMARGGVILAKFSGRDLDHLDLLA